MFSATYKFRYPTSISNRASQMSNEDFSKVDVKLPSSAPFTDFPFNCLLPIDTTCFGDLLDCDDVSPYYDFGSLDGASVWSSPTLSASHSATPELQSPCRDQGDGSEAVLSPISACFPTALSNYVSPRMFYSPSLLDTDTPCRCCNTHSVLAIEDTPSCSPHHY